MQATLHAASVGAVGTASESPASVAWISIVAALPSSEAEATVARAGTRSTPSVGQSNTNRWRTSPLRVARPHGNRANGLAVVP